MTHEISHMQSPSTSLSHSLPRLAGVFTRDILDIVDNLEHSHTNSWWSQGEDITKQTPIFSSSPYQFLLLAFQFGWMAPNLSQVPGPPPGVHVVLLSHCSQVMTISSQSHFFFYCHHPTSGPPFTCAILGVPLFASFPSSPFPIQSSALLPHSNTFRGFPLPSESSKNISQQNSRCSEKLFQAMSLVSLSGYSDQTILYLSYPLSNLPLHLLYCPFCLE